MIDITDTGKNGWVMARTYFSILAMTAFLIAAGFITAALPMSAWAQTIANPYQQNLYKLSEHLGALHYLRGQCSRTESTLWRDSMKELIRHENPSRRQARTMTEHFNDGYRAASEQFQTCSSEADREAEIRSAQAVTLTDTLLDTLE